MKSPAKFLRSTAVAFGLARKESDTAVIEAAIVDARAMIADGEREEAAALDAYRESLLADDGTPEAHLTAQMKAKIKRDTGEARVAELTMRLTDVRYAEEQARRRTIYEAAEAKAEAARVALTQSYPDIARQAHALLRTLAEAEIAVCEANAALPAGADHLLSPEADVRDATGSRAHLPPPTTVQLWAGIGSALPLPDEDQRLVKVGDVSWKGRLTKDGGGMDCHLRTYRKTVRPVPRTGALQENLAGTMHLPPLYAHTDPLWPAYRPGTALASRHPELTLDELAKVEPMSADVWRSIESSIPTEVVYEEISRTLEFEPNADAPAGAMVSGMYRGLSMGDTAIEAARAGKRA